MSSVPPTARPFSCLLVEDDPGFAQMLTAVVREVGGDPVHCGSLRAAREQLGRKAFDLVVLDNHLPDGKGFDFYFELARRNPAQTAIVLTGLPELAHAVELTRHGLFDYLSKPISADAFAACLQRARTRLAHLKTGLPAGELVAESPAMREVALLLQQAARHPAATVLLTGETGTGKDVAARALHQWTFASEAATTPYVAVNCASMPAEMFEAELFGSERGAYTGAEKAREGLVGAARDGTLFLDEIGEVPLPLQAKLLRFLEAREYRSLGSTATKKFGGRVVAATNRSLRDEVAAGRFRQDLLYRLDSFTVHLPPLRERREEIPVLAERLLNQLAAKYERRAPRLRPEELEVLRGYDYPGNVRELRNLLERSLLRTPPDVAWLALDLAWLKQAAPAPSPVPAVSAPPPAAPPPEPLPAPSDNTGVRDLPPLEAQEYALVRQALAESQGGIRRAAAKLGISHQALLRRLQKWPELRAAVE
jgi:DNA-binding NtrC family response regulator